MSTETLPLSLRDAFIKIVDIPVLRNREVILAEDITRLSHFRDHYSDVLKFETDLAQITDLIVLFCESEGSLAELGAFSMVEEIAQRLLVIIRDKHWGEDSFVKLGPLRSLENSYGSSAVCVLDDADIGMRQHSAANVNLDILKKRLEGPLATMLEKKRDPTTFDIGRPGHIIKLIVGIIQEYGALTIEEIAEVLYQLDVNIGSSVVHGYLLCAKSVNWIVESRKGVRTFYIARDLSDAAQISVKEDASVKGKSRRRSVIREHWSQHDEQRFMAVREVFRGSSRWAS